MKGGEGLQVKSGERARQISDVHGIISVNLLSTNLVPATNLSTAHALTLFKNSYQLSEADSIIIPSYGNRS